MITEQPLALAAPSAETAQLYSSPEYTAVALKSPRGTLGRLFPMSPGREPLVVLSPCPSCPLKFSPQHCCCRCCRSRKETKNRRPKTEGGQKKRKKVARERSKKDRERIKGAGRRWGGMQPKERQTGGTDEETARGEGAGQIPISSFIY